MQIQIWEKFKLSRTHRKDLDQLLAHVPEPDSKLKLRISWFFDLLDWVRREGITKLEMDFESGEPQAKRVQYFLLILERNPEWKLKVAQTFRSVIRDTRALDLFLETGLSNQDSFVQEFVDRLQRSWLPMVPNDHELSYIFTQNFQHERDVEWIRVLDAETFSRIEALFFYEVSPDEENWNTLKEDAEEAVALLSVQIQGLGLSSQIRQRISQKNYRQISFYVLGQTIDKYLVESDRLTKAVIGSQIDKKIQICFQTLAEVQQHLDDFGVSVHIVFQIEKLESLLRRVQSLVFILDQKNLDPISVSAFLEILVTENYDRRGLFSLLSQTFSLLARKIVERTAETGEHYITRTKEEYASIFRDSLGGGLITTFTTLIKFAIAMAPFSIFYGGLLAGFNYAISFLAIHFCHFTLATKQSSHTAPALAAKMQGIRHRQALDDLIDEIVNVIRSQTAAVIGNVLGVIPLTLAICWIGKFLLNESLIPEAKAHHVLSDFSILGPTPLFAAFTGVLLWLSSIVGGWVDNWYAYHRLSPALAHNRRLIFVFGETRMRAFSVFLKKNVVGIAGNASLGFMLGLAPAFFQFFGVFLEVRHVTLSSGYLAAASVSLPAETFTSWPFWSAILGIACMAVLNLLVSFSLALFLAIRARKIQAPERKLIYLALSDRLRHRPLSFIWPAQKSDPAPVEKVS